MPQTPCAQARLASGMAAFRVTPDSEVPSWISPPSGNAQDWSVEVAAAGA